MIFRESLGDIRGRKVEEKIKIRSQILSLYWNKIFYTHHPKILSQVNNLWFHYKRILYHGLKMSLVYYNKAKWLYLGLSEKDIPKDWCEAKKLKMSIKHQGCRPRTIRNKYCVGQCNSFVIPNEESENSVFVSCSACKYFLHF